MRLLLVAYDFPPVPSPQSLRWAYLARELALAGHDVHVLAPDINGYGAAGLPELPAGVRVHRVYPGPLAGLVVRRQRARPVAGLAPADATQAGEAVAMPPEQLNWRGRLRRRIEDPFRSGLNWKGQLMEATKAVASLLLFPDVRSEWLPWARKALHRLLVDLRPDAVITSHEPANTIALGLLARQLGHRWVADLGDPVLAPYTPRRWRRRAFAVERALCAQADLVTVTSERAASLLAERHGLDPRRCLLLTQGFDHRHVSPGDARTPFDPGRLELLYTGSFYAFRRIGHLLDAVLSVPGARLNVASIRPPDAVLAAAAAHPGQVRLFGFVAHSRALDLQRQCDVLVNLSNDDPVQVPGKVYEYLGAGTPVLTVGAPGDGCARLLLETGAGWCEPDDRDALARRITALAAEKRAGGIVRPPAGGRDPMQHSWAALAARLDQALANMPAATPAAAGPDARAASFSPMETQE